MQNQTFLTRQFWGRQENENFERSIDAMAQINKLSCLTRFNPSRSIIWCKPRKKMGSDLGMFLINYLPFVPLIEKLV